jgi:hypothetical protein
LTLPQRTSGVIFGDDGSKHLHPKDLKRSPTSTVWRFFGRWPLVKRGGRASKMPLYPDAAPPLDRVSGGGGGGGGRQFFCSNYPILAVGCLCGLP